MIRYRQGVTSIGCDEVIEPAVRGVKPATLCRDKAVLLTITEEEVWHAGDVQEDMNVVRASCSKHVTTTMRWLDENLTNDQFVAVYL